jgi:hypothetical protein
MVLEQVPQASHLQWVIGCVVYSHAVHLNESADASAAPRDC